METFLLVLCGGFALLAMVLWLRTRTIANRQFQRWRGEELAAARAEIARLASDEASLQAARWRAEQEAAIRQDAIARSGSVVRGRISEHLAPYFPGFPYHPRDVRFIGSPVDLLVFAGLEEGAVEEIAFIEVKTGTAGLSARQRQVRDAIAAGRVTWREWRIE